MTDFEEPVYAVTAASPKVYQPNMIRVATFIGGPLVAGYMIAENFKAFNAYDKAKKTWLYTIVFTIALFGLAAAIPASVNIPRIVFPVIYAWSAYGLVNQYQGKMIAAHINNNGEAFNWGRSIVIGLIGMVVLLVLIAVPLFLYYSMYSGV
ncbi:hypothetical protein A0256_09780 [Mucilaginibacter sp. PAMC 26640]|nr:hypothetical protein A0256_09780 [Mucilaginibacter sp. PAMC 26640]